MKKLNLYECFAGNMSVTHYAKDMEDAKKIAKQTLPQFKVWTVKVLQLNK